VQSGKVRLLAVGAAKRSAAKPELPTMQEAGVSGYDMVGWFGVIAPAGTPRPIINKLNAEVARILNLPDVRQRFQNLASDPVANSPEQFGALIKSEIAKWAKVAKAANIRLQ
jgi:tripartite-type tricarboxylate transporter receptor subunit TctC